MNPLIFNTLSTAAELLNKSDNQTDKLTAAVLYTILGSYTANNTAAILHIAETAHDEARAFVMLHDGE